MLLNLISDHVRCGRCNGAFHIPRSMLTPQELQIIEQQSAGQQQTAAAPESVVPCPTCNGRGWDSYSGGRRKHRSPRHDW